MIVAGGFRTRRWAGPKQFMRKSLAVGIFGLLLLSSCASESLRLGGPMPCDADPSSAVPISAIRSLPACLTTVSGMFFAVASSDGQRVAYIATSAPAFKTREGVRIGMSLREVRSHGGSAVVAEPGWGYYSKLRSGWNARFPGKPGEAPMPDADARVSELFRK